MNNHDLRSMQQAICEQDTALYSASSFPVVGFSHSFFQQEKMSISVSTTTSLKGGSLVGGDTTKPANSTKSI